MSLNKSNVDLTDFQHVLAEWMSKISEDLYCAGWVHGLEYALWDIITGQRPPKYGQGHVSEQDCRILRTLSGLVGGWIIWRSDETDPDLAQELWGEYFVPIEEWLEMVAARST